MKAISAHKAKEIGSVAVLMGGCSAEREISIESGTAVYEALLRLGVNAIVIDAKDSLVNRLIAEKVDRVFNIIHGRGGEDGVLQGVLETLKIPYTGSGVMASALTMDKLRTKLCWQGYGLNTPKWFVLTSEKELQDCAVHLSFPVIVKPAQEGSSIGMSKANNLQELKQAFLLAAEYKCDVYAEEWVTGKEYTIAVINGEVLPVIRVHTDNTFYDFEAKYKSNDTQYHCPCGLTIEQESEMQTLAVDACKVVGVTGWGRVDVFIDEKGETQLIEVNTVPGMTSHSLVPMAAKAAGVEFDELVWRILESSLDE